MCGGPKLSYMFFNSIKNKKSIWMVTWIMILDVPYIAKFTLDWVLIIFE